MSTNNPPDGFMKLRFTVGSLLILLLIGLLVWQRAVTGSYITGRQDWVLLLIGVALLTGIAFWLMTTSQGKFTLKKLGISLGGGAAIGASFMVLAWCLTKSNTTCVLVPLQAPPKGQSVNLVSHDDNLEIAYHLTPAPRVVVEFKEGKERGSFKTKHLADNKIVYLTYWVTRGGLEKDNPKRTEEPIPE